MAMSTPYIRRSSGPISMPERGGDGMTANRGRNQDTMTVTSGSGRRDARTGDGIRGGNARSACALPEAAPSVGHAFDLGLLQRGPPGGPSETRTGRHQQVSVDQLERFGQVGLEVAG